MQTFLPVPDFEESAKILDYRRLGKQRVEALMILRMFDGQNQDSGWRNHPATKMWIGHEHWLQTYALVMCNEWIQRGYKDTIVPEIMSYNHPVFPLNRPTWIGLPEFHLSHQSNLVRKFPEHYRTFFPDVPDDLPYFWPTKEPSES